MKRKLLTPISLLILIIGSICFSKDSYAQRPTLCQNSTVVLTNTIYNNYLPMLQNNIQFFTNPVCNATSYTWTIDGTYSLTTSSFNLTLDASDFLWLPGGGCMEFNANWTANPGSDTIGTYATTLSVKANAGSQNTYTIPIYILNVPKCTEVGIPPLEGFGLGYEGSEGDLKWLKKGLDEFGKKKASN